MTAAMFIENVNPIEKAEYKQPKLVIPWDEQQWQTALAQLCNNIEQFQPEQRFQWLQALWRYIETKREERVEGEQLHLLKKTLALIIRFTTLLCDWPLQIYILEPQHDMQPIYTTELAYAYWKIGQWQRAFELLTRQMLLSPNDHYIYQSYQRLNELSEDQGMPNFERVELSECIALAPLSYHHKDEFFWQYFDPQISQLCCLPTFDEYYTWSDWLIRQQGLADQTTFAVMHQYWGFIGVVSLVVQGHVGFFYYWIGEDFRGQGFGGEAASLLLAYGAEYHQIDCYYAKVFEHNIPSQKAMKKMGFQRLPFNAAPPNETEQLYYYGRNKLVRENALECQQLFNDMGSNTNVNMVL